MNKMIQRMKKLPGKHAVTNTIAMLAGEYAVMEVDLSGNVYQLDYDGKRDGPPLSDDNWSNDVIVLELACLEDS